LALQIDDESRSIELGILYGIGNIRNGINEAEGGKL
jgi:hypothetical protein